MPSQQWTCNELIVKRLPPVNRRGYCSVEDEGHEFHFTEAAVMLATAMHMFEHGAKRVELHPDGERAKRFEIVRWLESHRFEKRSPLGGTNYGGIYRRNDRELVIDPSSGKGDVVGTIDGRPALVECKGGVINSTHSGVASKLRKGLCELIGLLLSKPSSEDRQIAAVPNSKETAKLAARLALRANRAGIEIALVSATGELKFVTAAQS